MNLAHKSKTYIYKTHMNNRMSIHIYLLWYSYAKQADRKRLGRNLATYHLIHSLGLLRLYLHFRTACFTGEVLRHKYHYV